MSNLFNVLSTPAPFRLSISPTEIFAHPAWQRARETCLMSLDEFDCVLLCGVPGTGKSMLLHDLAETLRAVGCDVVLVRYGAPVIEAADSDILLIDEADRLSDAQIRQLCLRPNRVMLAGLPDLHDRVSACVERFGSVMLDPLSRDDVAELVAVRLAASGRSETAFTPAALSALARHSAGLFRVVVIVAGAALFFVELRGAETVDAADIDEAAAMREAIAIEAEEDAAPAKPVAVLVSGSGWWARRVLVAVVAVVAVSSVAVHFAVTAGGSAAAAVEVRVPEVQSIALPVAPEPPPPPPLSPKRKLWSVPNRS